MDLEKDRRHPEKSNRPLASGSVSVYLAAFICILLLLGSFLLLSFLPRPAFLKTSFVFGVYVSMMILYNAGLKYIFGLEMVIVSVGIMLRAIAGGVAVQVPITSWFIITLFFLCLMLTAGKRRDELVLLGDQASDHRPVLGEYQPELLDVWITITGSASLVTYTLWSMKTSSLAGTTVGDRLVYSVVFVILGLLRYLKLVYAGKAGAPELIFLRDWPMILNAGCWVTYLILVISI